MASSSLVPLVALFGYLLLLTIVLRDTGIRRHKLFLVYLAASVIWSLISFIALANFFPGLLSLWGQFWPVIGLWVAVSYYHFVGAFTQRTVGIWVVIGYTVMGVLTPLAAAGYAPQVLRYSGAGGVVVDYGPWLYLTVLSGALFIGLSVFYLVQTYSTLKDPLSQNRVIYLLIGAALLAVFSVRLVVPPFAKYPVEHLGNLFNSLLITYAFVKHELFDVKLAMRKGFAYLSISALIASLYLLIFWGLHYHLQTWTSLASFVVVAMTLVTTWLFYPLTMRVQRTVDKIYYGKSYDYRQMVLSFAQRTTSLLNLRELAEAMLRPIAKAMSATQVSLLLSSNGSFTSEFATRLIGGEAVMPIKLSNDSPIVGWLTTKGKPLSRELMDVAPEFKKLPEVERNIIEAVKIELLLPMKSKDKLVGILALSKKRSGGFYSSDDVDLLKALVDEAAVAIENAQLYAKAKERAHIDQLTGLLNHGYFHERLDEEISRCSRFGDVFSLVFLDLDLFKAYNDTYGHLAGDDVLRQIAQFIRGSIRGMDVAFRYGGDEFTIMLPQAPLDDAYRVAERIRRRIEDEMNSKGIALTCSLGVASWPIDGVMREELLHAADGALYHSKQTGRNRISLASEMTSLKMPEEQLEQQGDSAVLSTIHALAATVDAKDHSTYGHSAKASKYATDIARALGYSEEGIARIQAAALLHDIGKIRVSDALLAKRGPLNNDDWVPIFEHPRLGVAILKHVKGLNECLPAIEYHHERYDGKGYPAGLKGEDIPLDARILAVADAYDAMTSQRPYRDGESTHEQALEELKRCAGAQFDPEIVRVFVALWESLNTRETRERMKRSASVKTGDLVAISQGTPLVW